MYLKRDTLFKLPKAKRLRSSIAALAIAGAASIPVASAQAEDVLRVAMTAADIPINIGQPDQGFEGFLVNIRFSGAELFLASAKSLFLQRFCSISGSAVFLAICCW